MKDEAHKDWVFSTKNAGNEVWKAVIDGIPIQAEFNSKGAAEAGIEVERRRRRQATVQGAINASKQLLPSTTDGPWTPTPWPEHCDDNNAPDLEATVNYARARACVNYCAGIPTEQLPGGGLKVFVRQHEVAEHRVGEIVQENGDLLKRFEILRETVSQEQPGMPPLPVVWKNYLERCCVAAIKSGGAS